MVEQERRKSIYWPMGAKRLKEIEQYIVKTIEDAGWRDRMVFPSYTPLSTFEEVYDDLKKEYLVDFVNNDEEYSVMVPEYRTIIKQMTDIYWPSEGVKDHCFYYLQTTMAYTSIERKDIKEDLVLGFCIVNPSNTSDAWTKICKPFSQICRYFGKEIHYCVNFKNNGTLEGYVGNEHKDQMLVGFGKNEYQDGLVSCHFSLNDIFQAIN